MANMLTIIDNSDDSGDEFLMNVALRGRNAKIYRPREDHYAKWTDKEFFVRFRLTKETVLELLDLIREDLETSTDVIVTHESTVVDSTILCSW
uniref:Uncharacterized protein n=1 Tax=Timema douglasi TaxID=61478 RepID=A0A7R8VMA2_TIMDO|nr:unnamed protein product [Timema douglasi]